MSRRFLSVVSLVAAAICVGAGSAAGVNPSINFAPANSIAVDPSPSSVVAADFNGDAKTDLAATHFRNPGEVSILLGDGAGGFAVSTVGGLPVGTFWLTTA